MPMFVTSKSIAKHAWHSCALGFLDPMKLSAFCLVAIIHLQYIHFGLPLSVNT